ncbi:MAG: hypothetical protein JWL75_694 [Parcubacteria group bacterium]|nr:hypothetical protein [Parcubacteria group bacterium]
MGRGQPPSREVGRERGDDCQRVASIELHHMHADHQNGHGPDKVVPVRRHCLEPDQPDVGRACDQQVGEDCENVLEHEQAFHSWRNQRSSVSSRN